LFGIIATAPCTIAVSVPASSLRRVVRYAGRHGGGFWPKCIHVVFTLDKREKEDIHLVPPASGFTLSRPTFSDVLVIWSFIPEAATQIVETVDKPPFS
jgi:hypothetical protein